MNNTNLIPGGKPSRKNKLSEPVIIDLVKLLSANEQEFKQRLSLLNDKDYIDAHLKMLKLVLPKNINLNQPSNEFKPTVWEIIPASVALAREANNGKN